MIVSVYVLSGLVNLKYINKLTNVIINLSDSFLILTNIIGFTFSPPINCYKIVSNAVSVLLLASSYSLLIPSIPPPLKFYIQGIWPKDFKTLYTSPEN